MGIDPGLTNGALAVAYGGEIQHLEKLPVVAIPLKRPRRSGKNMIRVSKQYDLEKLYERFCVFNDIANRLDSRLQLYIESVTTRSGGSGPGGRSAVGANSVQSAITSARGFEQLITCFRFAIGNLSIDPLTDPVHILYPSAWKRKMGLTSDKKKSVQLAAELCDRPAVNHDLSEAELMAYYGVWQQVDSARDLLQPNSGRKPRTRKG